MKTLVLDNPILVDVTLLSTFVQFQYLYNCISFKFTPFLQNNS